MAVPRQTLDPVSQTQQMPEDSIVGDVYGFESVQPPVVRSEPCSPYPACMSLTSPLASGGTPVASPIVDGTGTVTISTSTPGASPGSSSGNVGVSISGVTCASLVGGFGGCIGPLDAGSWLIIGGALVLLLFLGGRR